jgi:hypothetical protein
METAAKTNTATALIFLFMWVAAEAQFFVDSALASKSH